MTKHMTTTYIAFLDLLRAEQDPKVESAFADLVAYCSKREVSLTTITSGRPKHSQACHCPRCTQGPR